LKNMLDMKRLRIHSSPAMDSRLFVQFIASVILTRELKVLENKPKQDNARKSCKMWLPRHKSTLEGNDHVSAYQ
jgi:hypothetical protein